MKTPGDALEGLEGLEEELRRERRRNLEDIMRHARWEAEKVKKMGPAWFEQRDRWLQEALKADRERWRDPAVRRALINTIELLDKRRRGREARLGEPY